MATEYRGLGTVVTLSAVEMQLTITLTGSVTINNSDSAYESFTGTWRFPDFCYQVVKSLKTWMFAAISADAGVTTPPSSRDDIDVQLTFTPSLTAGGSLCTLTIG